MKFAAARRLAGWAVVMPEFDGFQVLDALQRLPEWRQVLVYIWTSLALTDEEYAMLARPARAILI